jgi:hypothetical protein
VRAQQAGIGLWCCAEETNFKEIRGPVDAKIDTPHDLS